MLAIYTNKSMDIDEQFIPDENTAQSIFLNIIDGLDSENVSEIRITEVLNGDLDFAVLDDRGFKHIKGIFFTRDGKITSLKNIPNSVVQIECNSQQLSTIDGFPVNMEDLQLDGNLLTKLDLSSFPKLRQLHVSNNEITEIIHLPETIEEVYCENNQIRILDLVDAVNIKILHCSNNPLMVLERVPDSLTTILMENNPYMEINRTTSNETVKKTKKQINYVESLNEYFRLKQKYDSDMLRLKKSAVKSAVTRKEGRRKKKGVKAPCVGCGKKVGTIFSQDESYYTAICGDNTHPCEFNIKLFRGDYDMIDNMLGLYTGDIQDNKTDIIVQKMDTLFKYIDDEESSVKFKEVFKTYNSTSDLYKDMIADYDKIYNNLDRESKLVRKTDDMYKIRENIERVMQEYKKTGNREILIDAMGIYNKELAPVILEIRTLKYDNMFVEDKVKHTRLVQYDVSPHNKQFMFGDERKVVKYNVTP